MKPGTSQITFQEPLTDIFNNFTAMEAETQTPVIYSPAAVLNLFNNSISLKQTQRIIQLKGIFQLGKGGLYSGVYYDSLRDESSDAQITLIVPALIRSEMQPNKTITINGFITRRVVNNASRIEIQLTVTELVEQAQNKYSDDDIKKITLLQAKAAAGFKDVHCFIKERIVNAKPFNIGVIIGKTGIIDNDIKHQLRESIGFYDLSFHRISLSSETEILSAMDQLDAQAFDLIVMSRGGGENLEIFNKLVLAEKSITLKVHGLESKYIELVPEERSQNGVYINAEDLIKRTGIGLEQLITLIRVGALRFTGKSKKALLWEVYLFFGKNIKKTHEAELFSTDVVKHELPEFKSTVLKTLTMSWSC